MKKILLSALLLSSLAIDANAVTYAYDVASNYTGTYALSSPANMSKGNTSISSNYNRSGKYYLNAGHGGFESDDRPTPMPLLGGEYFYESEGNLDRTKHLQQFITKNGGQVRMQRTTNTSNDDWDLTAIASASSSYGGYFISLHSNGANASANYHVALYKGSNSSNSIGGSERMAYWNSYNNYKNGCLTEYTYSTPRSMADYDLMGWHYGVLRTNTSPGYLVETWFHDYRPESLRFKSSLYNKFLAWQIAVGNLTAPGGSGSLPACIVGDVRDTSKGCGYSNYTTRGRDSYLALNDVTVTLSGNGVNQTVNTGAKGNGVYAFFVPAGTYTLTFKKSGYKTVTKTVTASVNVATQNDINMSEGVDTGISLNPTSTGFGETAVGGTSKKTITVTGTSLSANITISNSDNTNFAISTTSLGASGGTFDVTYKPQKAGSHSTTISFVSGTHKASMVVTGTAKNPPLKFTEGWNYSETSNKKAAWMANWTNYRNMAFGNGKLYVVDAANGVVKVIKAQTAEHIKDLNMTGVEGGALKLVDVAFVDGKLVGTNIATTEKNPLKVYVWDNDDAAPRVLLETTDLGGMDRVGDAIEIKGNLTNGTICYLGQQSRSYTDASGNAKTGNCNSLITYAITNGTASKTPVKADIDAFIIGLSPRAIPYGNDFWVAGQNHRASIITSNGQLTASISDKALSALQGNDIVPFTFKGDTYAFATDYDPGTSGDASSMLKNGRAVLISAPNSWADAVSDGKFPSAGLGATRNTSLSSSICVNVNGEKGVEMWVLVHNQGIAYYKYGTAPTYSYEDPTKPAVSSNVAALTFSTARNNIVEKEVTIEGARLTGDISLAISGTDAKYFTVSQSTIAKATAKATVKVRYAPTAYGTHKATLKVTTADANALNIALEGTNEKEYEISGFGLTQEWAKTSGHLTANTQSRWATGFDDKIYINDHENSKLYYWNKDGLKDTGIATAAGTAITSDSHGNIIMNTSMYAAGCTSFKILPKGGSAFQDLTVTLPAEVTATQMQYMGQAIGNVMSAEGGVIYLFPKDATSVAKIIIKNGAQASATAISVGALSTAVDAQSIAVPLTYDINSNKIAVRTRAAKYFYTNKDGAFATMEHSNVNLTAGGTLFTLQNKLFAVEPVGDNYYDGFQIVDVATGDIVATHAKQITGDPACRPNGNSLTAKVTGEYTVEIYQYVPGQLAAKYKFEAQLVEKDPVVGVEEVVEPEAEVSVRVNGGVLAVEGVEAAAVAVYAMNGSMVRYIAGNEVDVQGLNGVYVVVVADKNGKFHTEKMVIR